MADPRPDPFSPSTLHRAASGFDRAAEVYDRGRPDYPPAAVGALRDALRLGRGATLLDLGAGTGKLTRRLAAAAGATVAVEPSRAMRDRLRRIGGIAPLGAVAEAIPLRGECLDGAVSAQAFHWFDGDRALEELHRVLKPGARLALIWNQRDDTVDWVARLSAAVNRREGDAPRYRSGRWREPLRRTRGRFGPLWELRFPHVHRLTPEAVLDRVASISFVAAMEDAARREVLEEVRLLLATHPQTRGRAEVELAYRTDLYWCERSR